MPLPPLSLYVHLPWCERKCPYCDFNSHEASRIPEAQYIEALLADLERDLHLAAGRTVQTLFIGGGTPSLFSADAIARLMDAVAGKLSLADRLEATMEANPGSAEAARFKGYRQAGINRLSLGVQSFQEEKLQALGRVHSGAQARAAIDLAIAAGFDNFNLDLMHGLPGQSPDDAMADLATAIDMQPAHLSWYQLTIEPNTVFYTRPPSLPVEDALGDIQDRGEELLAASGYLQYEISAYSRPGMECRHNLNYWSFGDYLAIGAGAHGKITDAAGRITRYAKTRAPADYLSGQQYTAQQRTLAPGEIIEEFMMFALRLNRGFTLDTFTSMTGLQPDVIEQKLSILAGKGLLLQQGRHIQASDLGRRFLDTVIAEFIS
ncbi:radical SAM family heme chaperone HemW [Pseudohalioglobus sediminis]|uniref:Heme chaperone HemW n=1 Tax=Pseudohalioglobus sediminis TaxID=2606449 RepID=A0A5B0WVQ3_9GAMM|nr:radical SAM family heme chaperone HemW [Pseudohalioglobus sediminis]KAA1190435.1 radical SAM family heme chaperone HemW [Pseudohalioglobus sediminis]